MARHRICLSSNLSEANARSLVYSIDGTYTSVKKWPQLAHSAAAGLHPAPPLHPSVHQCCLQGASLFAAHSRCVAICRSGEEHQLTQADALVWFLCCLVLDIPQILASDCVQRPQESDASLHCCSHSFPVGHSSRAGKARSCRSSSSDPFSGGSVCTRPRHRVRCAG
jgi:hypothetical protein